MTPVSPAAMLATLGTARDIDDETGWAFEMKWDGIRAIAIVDGGTVTLTSRNGHDLTSTYPELIALAAAIGGRKATIDGEIVAMNRAGRPDFGLLQQRMNLSRPGDVERAAKSVPVRLMVFDLLALDGRSLVKEGYDDRREALEALVRTTAKGVIQVPPTLTSDLAHAIETSRRLGLEGVVAKRRDGRYEAGRRSRSWTKIKHHRTQEVIVGGWRNGNGRRAGGVGSLLLGIPEHGEIRYVGRVGTGFSDRSLDEILTTLSPKEKKNTTMTQVPTADSRDAHWVEPDLVAEVEFAEWTADGRLRQPVWRGWRPDKDVADVRKE
jgi:bifunctional non-homologous end joining protein LigD